jgi:hypothetical protein
MLWRGETDQQGGVFLPWLAFNGAVKLSQDVFMRAKLWLHDFMNRTTKPT